MVSPLTGACNLICATTFSQVKLFFSLTFPAKMTVSKNSNEVSYYILRGNAEIIRSKCCQSTPKNSLHMSAMFTLHVDDELFSYVSTVQSFVIAYPKPIRGEILCKNKFTCENTLSHSSMEVALSGELAPGIVHY